MDRFTSKVLMPANATTRGHTVSRLSRLWSRAPSEQDGREVAEVPLFMSRPGGTEYQSQNHPFSQQSHRSHQSTRSLIDATTPAQERIRPFTISASSVYSQSPRQEQWVESETSDRISTNSIAFEKDIEANMSDKSFVSVDKPPVHRRRHRKVSRQTLEKIRFKARISLAFGITLLVSLIVYLAMAVSGIASGTMFHVLSVALILCLAGVFCHSSISLVMLLRRKNVKLKRQNRWWTGNDSTSTNTSSSKRSELSLADSSVSSTHVLDRQVFVSASSEEAAQEAQHLFGVKWIRPPPPVYGQHRDSIKLNPNLVHVEQVQLSPTTPTYDEAMQSAQQAVGYQPPLYSSNIGNGNSLRGSTVHPLERQRMFELLGSSGPSRL